MSDRFSVKVSEMKPPRGEFDPFSDFIPPDAPVIVKATEKPAFQFKYDLGLHACFKWCTECDVATVKRGHEKVCPNCGMTSREYLDKELEEVRLKRMELEKIMKEK